MKEWESKAIGLFGDCQIEAFDPEKGGCYYFAKNALAEHGDYRLGGEEIEDRKITAKENDTEIVPAHPQLKLFDDPKLPPPPHRTARPATSQVAEIPATRKRAAAYVRVSAGTQPVVLLHERIQARPIEQFIAKRGWKRLPAYWDVASAKTGKRWPRFYSLMAAVRRGEVDVVIVSRLDRIARSTTELVKTLAELQKLGVDFVSLEDGLDTTTRKGRRALFMVVTALVKMERGLRSERSETGLENAKQHGTKTGKPIGRPRAVVDIARVLSLKEKGWGLGRIGRKLGVSKSTVRRAYLAYLRAQRRVPKRHKASFATDRRADGDGE